MLKLKTADVENAGTKGYIAMQMYLDEEDSEWKTVTNASRALLVKNK